MRSNSPEGGSTGSTFCLSSIAGISTVGISGLDDTETRGLAFIVAMTSDMNVTKTSWDSWTVFVFNCRSYSILASSAYHPLSHSTDVWGVGRIKGPGAALVLEVSSQFIVIRFDLMFLRCLNEVCASSERKRRAGPRTAVNLLSAFARLEEDSDLSTSICTALVTIQVKITAQCLFSTMPPRICLELMIHGPNTSTPTFMNGGPVLVWQVGLTFFVLPFFLLEYIHLCMMLDVSLFPPISHSAAEPTASSVKCLHWWAALSW